MNIRTLLILAEMLALLSACSVGPDYVRPSAPVPPVFKEMSGWRTARPQDATIRGKWWEIFNDPQLNALEEQVIVSNQNLAAAEAQFRQARAQVQGARAGYFPTVTAGTSATRSRRPVTVGGTTTATTATDYSLPVDVSWEVDLWGRVRRTVEASRAEAQASAADLAALRLSVQATLAQDYFQLRTLDAQKKLLDSMAASFSRFLELTKNRYASGVASRADVLQAETQLRTTEAQAIDVGVQRAQLEHAIATLIGKPASEFSLSPSPMAGDAPPIPVGVPSQLLERRPDIAGAERRMAAANAEIGVAKAAYYPTVTLSGAVGFESTQLSDWLSWPSRFWSLGGALSETLFDGGLRGALTDQARAAYDATVAEYRQTVLAGFQEVEDNLAALRILAAESAAQEEAVQAARWSVEVTTNQYRAGTASALDVIVTQSTALTNERTAAAILGSRLSASVLLIKALGGGWSAAFLPSSDELDRSGAPKGTEPQK